MIDTYTAWISYKELKPFLYRKYKGCRACKNDNYRELVVHHVTYERYGREKMSDVRLLCFRCHDEFHREVKGTDPDLRMLTDLFIRRAGIWKNK